MKLPRYLIDIIRENADLFEKQTDSCALMPILPKRIKLLCDTALSLYDDLEEEKRRTKCDNI